MTSAITRAPAGAAHAHGFAKSLKGDTPAEGFEALFAAAAGAQPQPAMPPVVAETAGKTAGHGKTGDGTQEDDKPSPQQLLLAASMTFAPVEAKIVDARTSQRPANSQTVAAAQAAVAPRIAAFENTGADSTPRQAASMPASQRIVPNATFVITQPVAHELIGHKGRVAETPVPPTADPPRIARAPIASETAASPAKLTPEPVGAPVPSHAEAKTLPPAPPSSQPEAAVEHTRSNLSPRALVQAAMVEVVRSPGRGRMPAQDAANADASDPPQPNAPNTQSAAATPAPAGVTPAPAASTPIAMPSIVEQAVVADFDAPIAQPVDKAAPASRAAADIARQRQFVLASADASSPTAADAPEIAMPTFETLIALRKADGTLDTRAEAAPGNESISPAAPAGAWLANLPSSTTQAPSMASAVGAPRVFDQAAWSAALAQQVTASAISAMRETTVRIKPDGLGPIEVRVRVGSEHVDVRFAIEHPVTVNMVREALPDLQKMLAQSGLSLGDAQVAQQNAGNRGQAARSDAPVSQTGDDEPAAAMGAVMQTRPRARVGLLDDFV